MAAVAFDDPVLRVRVMKFRVAVDYPQAETDLPAGPHTAVWHGDYNDGRAAPSGVYLARLVAGERTISRRVTLVR